MGHKTFIGGVHPYDGKELSKDSPIKEVLPKGDMVYPVSQHIGAPAKPVVAVGDTVLKGQMIAEAGGFVSSPIYSSVSGKVKAIEKRRVAVGDMVDSIVIEMMACLLRQHMRASRMSLRFQRKNHREGQECGSCRHGRCRFPYTCKAFSKGAGQD